MVFCPSSAPLYSEKKYQTLFFLRRRHRGWVDRPSAALYSANFILYDEARRKIESAWKGGGGYFRTSLLRNFILQIVFWHLSQIKFEGVEIRWVGGWSRGLLRNEEVMNKKLITRTPQRPPRSPQSCPRNPPGSPSDPPKSPRGPPPEVL